MDKSSEKLALNKVFGNRAKRAVASERPDFVIGNATFAHGIEITELYASVIDGKLQNLPSYTSGLLEDTQTLHRKDRDTLRVESVTIEHKDGSGKIENVRALFQLNPTTTDKFNLLAAKVDEKSVKHKDYLINCDFVDLVVWDRSYLFHGEHDLQLLTAQLAENREFLTRTPFREVFILGRTTDPSTHFIYPLRGNLLLVDALLLDQAFLQSGGHVDDPQRVITLAGCLSEIGHSVNYEGAPSESIHTQGWQLFLQGLDLTLRNWTDLPELQPRSANDELSCVNGETIRNLVASRSATHCLNTLILPAHDT